MALSLSSPEEAEGCDGGGVDIEDELALAIALSLPAEPTDFGGADGGDDSLAEAVEDSFDETRWAWGSDWEASWALASSEGEVLKRAGAIGSSSSSSSSNSSMNRGDHLPISEKEQERLACSGAVSGEDAEDAFILARVLAESKLELEGDVLIDGDEVIRLATEQFTPNSSKPGRFAAEDAHPTGINLAPLDGNEGGSPAGGDWEANL